MITMPSKPVFFKNLGSRQNFPLSKITFFAFPTILIKSTLDLLAMTTLLHPVPMERHFRRKMLRDFNAVGQMILQAINIIEQVTVAQSS